MDDIVIPGWVGVVIWIWAIASILHLLLVLYDA